MKLLTFLLLSVFLSSTLSAQVIDDSDLKKLESGQYKLAEAKIQVSFELGVSEEEMRTEITRLGYEVESAIFENIVLNINNKPEESQIEEIAALAVVNSVLDLRHTYDPNMLNQIKQSRMMSDSELNELIEQLEEEGPQGLLLVYLNAEAIESTVEEIRSQFENLEMNIFRPAQRTAIIKTEPGKELEAMDELNAQSFVESTAFIGVIE
ncbi:MAG TPA: hypothetical protein VFM80_06895 [Gracilimonas sp.]|uniref:hypothetical protein n=1 Tax=Gracilimonas sp. TaxID=1974203 RepID=UPI002D90C24A|nr:hypothetical protein [Gracilimonas sp.]